MFSFKNIIFLLIILFSLRVFSQDQEQITDQRDEDEITQNLDIEEDLSDPDVLEDIGSDEIGIEKDVNTDPGRIERLDENVLIEQIENLNKVNEGNFTLRPFIYSQKGRRDPFTPIVGDKKVVQEAIANKEVILPELEKYRIDSFVLTSILWSVNEPKALIMDPQSKIHLIKVNSRIGTKNGYVAKIREGEIVVVEQETNEAGEALFTTQVLKIGR